MLSSGQLASLDRRLCKGPLNGPTATGQHCPEGWKLYAAPGPNFKGAVDSASADSLYYNFVDQFDMLGVGKDVPIVTGNESEALLALVDGKFLTLRVPYPMGFFAKGMDGRIDDPNAGWKGKAIYTHARDSRTVPRRRWKGRHQQAREVPGAGRRRSRSKTERRGWRPGKAEVRFFDPASTALFLLVLRERPDVVHDLPDVLVLQLIAKRAHAELGRDAVLDRVENLAVC